MSGVKPFLLLATRAEDEAADDEYAAMLRAGGLDEPQLHRVRLEAGPMPVIDLDRYSGVVLGGGPFDSSDPEETKSDTQRRVEAELRHPPRRAGGAGLPVPRCLLRRGHPRGAPGSHGGPDLW